MDSFHLIIAQYYEPRSILLMRDFGHFNGAMCRNNIEEARAGNELDLLFNEDSFLQPIRKSFGFPSNSDYHFQAQWLSLRK